MKAMLFAAGLGTRLKPLTENKPKALVKCNNTTLLEHNILRLKEAGIRSIVINIHHFSQQIIDFIALNNSFGIEIIISDESNMLLDTGGGLKNATKWFNDTDYIILQNADIISNIDYKALYSAHIKKGAIATLATRKRETSRYLLCNAKAELIGWKNTKTNEIKRVKETKATYSQFGFSGIHIISSEIFNLLPETNNFNIIQWYLDVAKKHIVNTFDHSNDYWFDIGTIDKLNEAENYFNNKKNN